GLGVKPGGARRAPGGGQLLVLQVADLGGGYVRALLAERLAGRDDRHRRDRAPGQLFLRAGAIGQLRRQGALQRVDVEVWSFGGHQRVWKVSLYLPICSSSPSCSCS